MRMNMKLLELLDAEAQRICFLREIKSGSIEIERLEKLLQIICDAPETASVEVVNRDIAYIIVLLHVMNFGSKRLAVYDDRKSTKLDELYSLLAIELSVHFQ